MSESAPALSRARSPTAARFFPRLERAWVLALALSFTLPLLAGGLARILLKSRLPAPLHWLRNDKLSGVQIKPEPVPLSLGTLRSARYQAAYAREYDTDFTGRALLIRVVNELYLRLLHTASNQVVVGPQLNLTEYWYPYEYCHLRPGSADALRPLVDQLRRLQDFCAARGIAFALAITPSKSAVLPETTLPESWRRKMRPGARYYDVLLPLLRAAGIRYVDGHALTVALAPVAPTAVFPEGGVHWGDPAALATSNALLVTLAAQGLPVAPIRDYISQLTYEHAGQDKDMADLVNILSTLRYPVTRIDVRPMRPAGASGRPTLVVVGGSFTDKITQMLGDSRQFSEIETYGYYKHHKDSRADGPAQRIATPTTPLDFESEIFAADSLVLEVNEQVLPEPRHLAAFLGDALAVLPDPRAPKAPFRYEGQSHYRWGDILSFITGQYPVHLLNTTGLSDLSSLGAFTDGPKLTMSLDTPPAAGDMTLEVDAFPFLGGGKIPGQTAQVSVNGHAVGEMVWAKIGRAKKSLVIPRAYLDKDQTVLEFRFDHAAAPASLGVGPDVRRLAICLATLRMDPTAGGPAPSGNEELPRYRWGDRLLLTDQNPPPTAALTGFTPPGGDGSFTSGPESTLRLRTAPAPADMVLEMHAGAMLAAPRLTRQIVGVYVNHHPVARWLWTDSAEILQTTVVPRSFLDGDTTLVEWRVEHPVSPAALGLAPGDDRPLGICVRSLRFYPDPAKGGGSK